MATNHRVRELLPRSRGGKKKLTKKAGKTSSWILVETVQLSRARYLVETPTDKPLWALDTVVMEEASPFSGVQLGENIVSWREVDIASALKLAEEDGVDAKKAQQYFHSQQDPVLQKAED